jgi:erythromycin esterase-like protein
MRVRCLLLAVVFLLVRPAYAQQDSTLTRLIRQHRTSFTPAGQQFTGPGWETLQHAISQSQFVLLGEEPHGAAEIPGLVDAVARVLHPKALVAEISPYEAQQLNQLAAQPGLPTAYQQRYPFSLSFYSWTEEFELAQALQRRGVPVVGIDMLYVGNSGHLLAQMADLAHEPRVQRALRQMAQTYLTHDRLVYQPGSTTPFYLNTRSPAALDSLLALTTHESLPLQEMAKALATSYAISRTYQTHTPLPTGFSGHQARVNLLKRTLLSQLKPYQTGTTSRLPKLLFKFGTNHVGRDRALESNIFDIGNLMANLADAQDSRSLHLLVVGQQGTQNTTDTFDHAHNSSPLTPQDNAYLQVFFTQAGPAWQLVDLRPARQALLNHQVAVQNPLLERTLLNFDYLIVIPTVTASSNY